MIRREWTRGYGGGCRGKRPGSSSEFVRNKSGGQIPADRGRGALVWGPAWFGNWCGLVRGEEGARIFVRRSVREEMR